MDTLAQAYRWSYDQIAKLTYPQVIMLNHAADCNRKRLDARIKERQQQGESTLEDDISDMPIANGKRLDDMTSDEYMQYMGREGPRPRVIKIPKKTEG